MLLLRTDRLPRFGRGTTAFKVAVWAVCAYTVIAALHGVAPQMWRHHCSQGDDNGPFRVLLFTLFTAIAMAVFALAQAPFRAVAPMSWRFLPAEAFKAPCLLRGPPRS